MKTNNIKPKDVKQILSRGLTLEQYQNQLESFHKGIPYLQVESHAGIDNGIRKLSKKEVEKYARDYEARDLEVVKFVPASGAATRMFKFLQLFFADFSKTPNAFSPEKIEDKALRGFFNSLPDFPFYKELLSETKKSHSNFDKLDQGEKNLVLLKTLLQKYSSLPKGLIPFHKYSTEIRTAFEEHFVEAAAYATKKGISKLHFTVSEAHVDRFKNAFKKIKGKRNGNFQVSYSFQQKKTDTLAVDLQNQPIRDENGKLIFRPGGHGALLENLNQIDTDIIFIKNIDNVAVEKNLPVISTYKKALAGILLEVQTEAFRLLHEMGSAQKKLQVFAEASAFLEEKLNIRAENPEEIKYYLNRPIRVCGMVKNTGAPGGGPFWVREKTGKTSLQIVETAQIDLENPQQKNLMEKATHFNPVDLVCGVRDYRGNKFDLNGFSNPEQGFISTKSINGKEIKALELPGLWNGAMAKWNSIFVEVPLESFNPVKTLMDLLKPGHRGTA